MSSRAALAAEAPGTPDAAQAGELADLLRVLGHPLRLRIVALLCGGGPMNVGALTRRLQSRQAIVSQQLRLLRMAGVVAGARRRGEVHYSLLRPHLRELLACLLAGG